jgi:hypothetical protein
VARRCRDMLLWTSLQRVVAVVCFVCKLMKFESGRNPANKARRIVLLHPLSFLWYNSRAVRCFEGLVCSCCSGGEWQDSPFGNFGTERIHKQAGCVAVLICLAQDGNIAYGVLISQTALLQTLGCLGGKEPSEGSNC